MRTRRASGWTGRIAALLAGVMLAGCASDNLRTSSLPVAGPLPPAAPRAGLVERRAAQENNQLLAAFGGQYRAPGIESLLSEMVTRLSPALGGNPAEYRVTILNSPAVNAFALPTGDVYVTRGLLALANDTSEVAAVLAHEIAHVRAGHALERAALERRSALISRVAAEVLNDATAGQIVQEQSRISIASFSRQQELEADLIGVKALARAGYDPYGAARFLVSLGRNSASRTALAGQRSSGNPDFLSTHPNTPERVSLALTAAREISAPGEGESDRNRYLDAIEGLAFGDDPSRGLARGNRYVNPTLGVAFEAPDGFVIETGSDAVIGIRPGGSQALRFDQVQLPAGQSLEAFIASGWIENVETGPVERLTLNGLPAVTASARGREWSFRFVAIQTGDSIQRLIYAAQGAASPDIDASFRRSALTFRQTSPGDVASIRPLRLSTIVAAPSDTAETLAARMANVGAQLERFAILNGLERNPTVRAGQRYKIVVE